VADAETLDTADHPAGAAPELPAELRGLGAAAAAMDQALSVDPMAEGPAQAEAEPVPVRDRGAELSSMLGLLVKMASPLLPFLPACYTPEVCDNIGTAFAAVADKHGWDLGAVESPELALAVVSIPPTIGAVMLGRQYFAHQAAQAQAQQGQRIAATQAQADQSGHRGVIQHAGA
jgi:hypothetical protein